MIYCYVSFSIKTFKIYCIKTPHCGGFSLTVQQYLSQFLSVFLHHVQHLDFACCCSSGANAPRCLTLCGSALRRWRREGLMKWEFTGSLEWPQTSRPSKLHLTLVRDYLTNYISHTHPTAIHAKVHELIIIFYFVMPCSLLRQ